MAGSLWSFRARINRSDLTVSGLRRFCASLTVDLLSYEECFVILSLIASETLFHCQRCRTVTPAALAATLLPLLGFENSRISVRTTGLSIVH
jgi:hypothetical protein